MALTGFSTKLFVELENNSLIKCEKRTSVEAAELVLIHQVTLSLSIKLLMNVHSFIHLIYLHTYKYIKQRQYRLQYKQDTRKTIECLSKLVTLKEKTRKKTHFPPHPSLPTTERKQLEQSRILCKSRKWSSNRIIVN